MLNTPLSPPHTFSSGKCAGQGWIRELGKYLRADSIRYSTNQRDDLWDGVGGVGVWRLQIQGKHRKVCRQGHDAEGVCDGPSGFHHGTLTAPSMAFSARHEGLLRHPHGWTKRPFHIKADVSSLCCLSARRVQYGGVLMYIAALEMPPQHADCGFIFYGSLQHGMWLWNTRLLELAWLELIQTTSV